MKIRWELPGRDAWLTSADVPIILTDQYHTCAVDCLAALAKTIVSKHSIELPQVWKNQNVTEETADVICKL